MKHLTMTFKFCDAGKRIKNFILSVLFGKMFISRGNCLFYAWRGNTT